MSVYPRGQLHTYPAELRASLPQILALIYAQLLDAVSFIVMGVAHESNPAVLALHSHVGLAGVLALRFIPTILFAAALPVIKQRYRILFLIPAIAGLAGAASNIRILILIH